MLTPTLRRVVMIGLTAFTVAGITARGAVTQESLNDGYSLFYHFCDQEKDLGLLTYVKSTTSAIADYERRISAVAKEDLAILTKLSKADSEMRLDKVSLPSFEIDVRKSMDVERQHRLIFGTTGAAYTQAVLMTQSEATNYGLNVAKTLAEQEPDPDRAAVMRRIYMKWSKFHEEAYQLNR